MAFRIHGKVRDSFFSVMSLIRSRIRVADHGEVFAPPWMVEAMLDLVKGETERIDSRFLEPACGSGNFLVRVLQRKLAAVEVKFGMSEFEKRHYALLALMCTYGIELLVDNIAECLRDAGDFFCPVVSTLPDNGGAPGRWCAAQQKGQPARRVCAPSASLLS